MMYNLRFLPGSRIDFHQGKTLYANDNARIARRFESAVDRVVGFITSDPRRYAFNEDGDREAGVKGFPFSVIYRVDPNYTVVIIAIAHAARDRGYWHGR